MTYDLVLTKRFEDDLDAILDYIINTLCSPAAAKGLYRKIKEQLLSVASFPNMFPLYGTSEEDRFFTVGNYIVFYSVDDSLKTVYVKAVLYAAMDIK